MKFFAAATAALVATAAAEPEADPQLLAVQAPVVHASPLLKTIVPATTYIKPAATVHQVVYKKPVVQQVHYTAPVQTVQYQTPVALQAPLTYTHQQVIKPVEFKPVEYKTVEAEKKVETVAYAQPMVYPTQYATQYAHPQYVHQPLTTYAAQPVVYNKPVQKVYEAQSAEGVKHTVYQKREAEAEPIDYVQYPTGHLSSIKVPTLEKTLRPYNKVPVTYANQYVAPVTYANQYVAPATYANQYVAPATYAHAGVYNYNTAAFNPYYHF